MKEKKLIIVKRISKAKEFGDKALGHCKFWGLSRDDEAAISLSSESEVAQALKSGARVFAVTTGSVNVPLAYEVEGWRVADIMKMRIVAAGRDFRDEFLEKLAEGEVYYDTDLWKRLGLEAHFKHLLNGQKAFAITKHSSGAIDPEQFNIGEEIVKVQSIPGWCVYARDEGLVVTAKSESPSQRWNQANEMLEKESRVDWITILIDILRKRVLTSWMVNAAEALCLHPFRTVFAVVAFVVLARFIGGCLSSYSEKQERSREAERAEWGKVKPVNGSISIKADETDNESAVRLLCSEAEAFARDTVSTNSGRTKAWANGAKIMLAANAWANIATSAQRFASESSGDFTCEVSGNDIVIIANVSKIRSFVLDVSQLNGDLGLVGRVESLFPGINFNGRTVVGPKPFRAKTVAEATRAFSTGDVRMELVDGSTFVFTPNLEALVTADPAMKGRSYEEIKSEAERFWREDAAEKFASLPVDAKNLSARFSELDHEYSDGFAEAAQALEALAQDCVRKADECRHFAGQCDTKWRRLFAPTDMASKRGAVLNAASQIDALKVRVASRLSLVAFDECILRFEQNEKAWKQRVGAMITAYNNQQAVRKPRIVALIGEIVSAYGRYDFSEINSFSERIAALKSDRMQASKDETMAAQTAKATFTADYVKSNLGSAWAKSVKAIYGNLPDASVTIDNKVRAFEEWAVGYFCRSDSRNRTLSRAMENAQNYADTVCYNHAASSVPSDLKTMTGDLMGYTEIALLARAEDYLAMLMRRQRKAQQR